ncbi:MULTISPECIES: translocation/assembly module TamB domain-containing protein [Niastella]|uniref:Translocation/assembly module TamB domain-containing protein n=1 Tax=Niastella soli TaxID=2821487 RepID=A0ABS3YN14_9BACT|nr:translocation/assembly module TamB [Niastella soli]MBO9199289.1 translocation/assembly module TamB domain-containing protein [Niastella soli]
MKKAGKITLKILLWFVAVLLLIAVLVQTPPVQNFARKKVQTWLSQKLGTRFEIGRLRIGFPSSVVLDNVYIEDKTKDTLLYGGRIKVSLQMLKLLHNEVQIGDIRLQNMTAKIKRQLPDTTYNFQFIIDAFVSENKKPAKPADTAALKMGLDNVYLDNIRFIYKDTISGNDWTIQLGHFNTHIDKFDPQKQVYSVPVFYLDGLTAQLYQYKPLVTVEDVVANDSSMTPMPVINLKQVQLKNIDVDYQNNVSAFYTQAKIKDLDTRVNTADLNGRRIILDRLRLLGVDTRVTIGKTEGAKLVKEKAKTEAKDIANQSWLVNLGNINIQKTNFQFDDENQPRQNEVLDYGHLNATDITLQARSFLMDNDTIMTSIQEGSLKEQSGFTLKQLQGDLVYTNKKVYADNLLVETPGTRIKHTIHLDYPSLESIKKNIGHLQVRAVLPGCYVSNRDILYFMPDLKKQPGFGDPATVFHLNADVSGRVDNLNAKVLQLQGWNNTKLDVAGTIVGLPSIEKVYGDVRINEIRTTRKDAEAFLPESVRKQVAIPETVQLTGTVKGNTKQMTTNVVVKSSAGNITLKGSMNNYQDMKAASYDMQVKAQQVQAGAIMKDTSLQTVTADIAVKGKGLTQETADATLKGTVASVVFRRYNYQNINLDAAFKNQQATTNVSIADDNIRVGGSISVNLALADPALTADVMIDSIKTKPLHFTTQDIIYRGKIEADLSNINPDSLQGDLLLVHSLLVNGNQRLQLDTLLVKATQNGDSSRIMLESDIAKARLTGKYKLTQIGDIFSQAIQPYFAVMSATQPPPKVEPYNFRIGVYVKDNPALKAMVPTITQFQTLFLTAHFSSDSGWQARGNMPLLVMGGMTIENLHLDAGAADSALHFVTTVNQFAVGGNTVYNARINANAAHNKIDFATRFHDRAGRIQYAIPGTLQQPQSGIYDISLKSDSLLLNYDFWTVAPDNQVHIGKNDIRMTNFILNHFFQQFSLKSRGNVLNAPVEASFTSFQISTLAAFVTSDSMDIDGTLDGKILLHDITSKLMFSGDVTINNLNFKKDTVGNIIIKAKNTTPDIINADVALTGRGNHATVNGDFYLKPVNGNDFQFKVSLDTINLASIEGATMGAIKNASGNITGKFDVSGTFSKFNIDGGLNFKKTNFVLSMVNNNFSIEDETITVNNEGIKFDSFTLEDSAKNKAILDGMVYTTDFTKYKFDLSVKATNFQAMNSTKKENSLYYGKLIFSSNMKIKGTTEQPVVDGSITIGDKTNVTVVLPQTDPSVVTREGIVQFVDMDAPENDTLFMKMRAGLDSLNKSGLTGLDISANVEIKKEAEFTMIVDEGNGDFVRMQGEGLLTGGIDPSGKTTLTGSYEIKSGSYELNYNMLRRKFNIQEGSKIVWNGEPTSADLDVTAIYTVKAAPMDLVKNQVEGEDEGVRNTYLTRLPFEVLLKLKGELMQPQVSFDIQLPESSNEMARGTTTTINNRLIQLREEPSELNKQVFALILLNRFVGDNPFESSAGGVTAESLARQSASKLLTEQLNRLAGSLVHGVDINFDVTSYDDYSSGSAQTRTEMNVGVSKNLLSDRLRVTVGSNFDLEGSAQTSSGSSNAIAGNVAVDYSLSKDRRYMLRGYRKNEYEGAIDGYVIETGAGFIITLDYNKFRNLFLGKKGREERRQRMQRAREQEQQQQKPTPPAVPQQTNIPSSENRELIKREDS